MHPETSVSILTSAVIFVLSSVQPSSNHQGRIQVIQSWDAEMSIAEVALTLLLLCLGARESIQSLADLPITLLRAELARRTGNEVVARGNDDGSTCGTVKQGSYNTSLHVLALFLILGLSTLGRRPFWECLEYMC